MKKKRIAIFLVAFAAILTAQSINAEPNYSAINTSNARSNLYLQQALELVSKQFGLHFEVDVDISTEKVIMMEKVSQFIEKKLKLKVNQEKSQVALSDKRS